MADKDMNVRIRADVAGYLRGMNTAAAGTKGFAGSVGSEFARIKGFVGSMKGMLAGLGVAVGGMKFAMDTAQFEQDMRRLQVNIGASRDEMEAWRQEAYGNQKNYGTSVADQKELADSLQAAGLNMSAIRAAAEPVSKALVVAKTNAGLLGKALGVAQEQFKVDLTDTNATAALLDKMVVAGRLGNAELENLPDIFARVGGRAREANFNLDQTLALVETLSQSEPQAERLSTLVDSTLRIFTNDKYMKEASKVTGAKFFDEKGARRDPTAVLKDFKKAYDKLTSDAQRNNFIAKAFGKTDLDTQRGLKKALEDGTLSQMDEYYKQLQSASGTIDNDLKTAMDNAVSQASRLKAAFKESVEDGLFRPVLDVFSKATSFVMDKKEDGGLGMDGKKMMTIGGGTLAAAYLGGAAFRMSQGRGLSGGLLGKTGGMAGGLAMGKVMEQAAGVQSVYVVNMPGGGLAGVLPGNAGGTGGLPGAAGGAAGAISKLGNAANVAVAGLSAFGAGYSAGTAIRETYMQTETGQKVDNWMGEKITQGLALLGNKTAQDALAINQKFEAQSQHSQSVLEGTGEQAAQSVKAAGEAAATAINQSKIEGAISVRLTAPPGFGVQTSVSEGKNTKLNLGVATPGGG